MRVIEGLGQYLRHLVDAVEREPVPPHVERFRPDKGRHPGDSSRLPDDEVLLIAKLRSVEEAGPVDPRRLVVEVCALPRVVGLGAVLALLQRLVSLRNLRFQRDDLLGARLWMAKG